MARQVTALQKEIRAERRNIVFDLDVLGLFANSSGQL